MWKEFNLINSFTLESSFMGPTTGTYKDTHFTIKIFKDMGAEFCKALADYTREEERVKVIMQELEIIFPLQADGTVAPISAE